MHANVTKCYITIEAFQEMTSSYSLFTDTGYLNLKVGLDFYIGQNFPFSLTGVNLHHQANEVGECCCSFMYLCLP